eukprot:NODE_3607_length_389_cov_247.726471_g3050_i0.p1 GENE.NODE_3607_length_389_cov_247.726471_g3050_i0~~NODE_3607_length_389_cov_247.726471_g3050_i0.p1  ORF type:complete len:102 (+),score=21.02 NODE_3607_length_389_cov_247.726471_g3050_i0:33-338(+)
MGGVDFDCYFHKAAVAEADLVVTDDLAQLEHFREIGYFSATPTSGLVELCSIVASRGATGRKSPRDRIIAFNLGLALDDVAVAPLVIQAAREKALGKTLDL